MSNASDDEYAAFDFSEFTAEDLQQIDADIARKAQGGPQITIELEPEPEPSAVDITVSQPPELAVASSSKAAGKQRATADAVPSPLEHFRYGVLSVTDLASLAWCEVQVDYGLRQRRSRPVAMRPASFVSAQGKEIFVEKAVAEQNEQITKQGRAVHKHLEHEIRPKELQVDVTSEEERWALRLVNMLASLDCIVLEGFTREMPVFGILQAQVVVGVIDEVVRRPQTKSTPQKRPHGSSPATPKSKKPRRSPSPSQPLITEFLPGSQKDKISASNGDSEPSEIEGTSAPLLDETSVDSPPSQNILHLIDTKTRRTKTLPSHEDTLPSRIQLMLYYRLLLDLTSTSSPFDFASFWRRLDVNPSASFSNTFLVQAGLITEDDRWSFSCLNDLAQSWVQMVQALDVAGIDTALQIIYRLQPRGYRRKFKNKDKGRARAQNSLVAQEDLDLARAIEASLLNVSRDPSREFNTPDILEPDTNGVIPLITSVEDAALVVEDPPKAPKPKAVSSEMEATSTSIDRPISTEGAYPLLHDNSDDDLEIHDMPIIGTMEFKYEEPMLNNHLVRALQWWNGYREPQGVSLEDSRRCRWVWLLIKAYLPLIPVPSSCEYENHCEWREKKALEIKERAQGRK
ncbi:hypothetical protein D9615_001136 [Tricholomella constricta]|uniref:Uncharacterized protein n=1 Tax=Tricholomella constricta TaxID=117010 RepID=A0A8H5HKW8_9AGAR|nr:hypothetical protein D9615_001136 [Tricholomella constricta]